MTLVFAWLPRRIAHFRLAADTFAAAGAAVGILAIRNKILGVGLVEGTRVTVARELNSALGDPNDLALILLFPLSFALILTFRSTHIARRMLGVVSLAVISTAIVLTQSRGGLIGMLAVLAAFLLSVSRSKVACVVALLVTGSILYAVMGVTSRTIGVGDGGLDLSATERIETWKAATSMAIHRPLTGVGLSNFADVYFFYTSDFHGHGLVAHSTWFSVLEETGFPGIIAFVLLIVKCFSTINRTLRHAAGQASREAHAMALALFVALVGFCASGTFLNQAFTWPIYVLVGLIAALGRMVLGDDDNRPAAGAFALSGWRIRP